MSRPGQTLSSPRLTAAAPIAAAVVFCILITSSALAAAAAPRPAAVEVVPTARREPATWRYTFDRPADNWSTRDFDDAAWQQGRGGFGTDGTPAVVFNTRWTTRDIWLRREITLPVTKLDLAALQLLVFHDEDVEIYFDGVLAARARGFTRDYEPMEISAEARRLLKPGARIRLAVHCRQTNGGQGVDVGLASVPPDWLAERRREHLRGFAMSTPGDAAAGRRLFLDEQRLGCSRCHSVDGSASRAGPDLGSIADKFPRAELINAVLVPSAQIAIGYEATVVTTRDDAFIGVVKESDDDHVGLMGGDGKLVRIAAAEVRQRRTQNTSMMPRELESNLSDREFTDLIEYLVSLRLPAVADAGRAGMPTNIPELSPPIALVPIHSDANRFERPCWLGQIPGQPNAFIVLEHQTGRAWRLVTSGGATSATNAESKTLWGDFHAEIRRGDAIGLLGLAFHPRFRENRKCYVQHQLATGNRGRLVTRVSEKIAAEDFLRDSGQPSRTIIEIPCSTDVHSGGGIEFGPDGFLYIGMGDTGPQGDPQGHGQDRSQLLGKMLRIDVDHAANGAAYAIPDDNPFVSRDDLGAAGVQPEIWAWGFREPWRFSFDSKTGDLWVGDVGQDRIEEVSIVRRGENHGWNVYEGFDLFSTRYRTDAATFTPPIFAYNRRLGNSVTGGYVYRGEHSPFDGVYICGDFTSKRVWGLAQADRKLSGIWQLATSPEEIASFGRDEAGRLYLVGYQGTIFRLDFAPSAAAFAKVPRGTSP